jgi:hypothetical protein
MEFGMGREHPGENIREPISVPFNDKLRSLLQEL